MRRFVVSLLAVALIVGALVPPASSRNARTRRSAADDPFTASPVATSDAEYTAYGRVFPDPHGCHVGEPGYSPWAKGTVCAVDFLGYQEMVNGITYMESLFPRFVRLYRLDKDFDCKGHPVKNPDKGCPTFLSAGLPETTGTTGQGDARARVPLYMVRITDESAPEKDKRHFVFPLSIHGIERAGAEGGTRAAEDLATWAACEAEVAPDVVDCANEGNAAPHPLLEATPDKSVTAGKALKESSVFFIYPNPDGWLRGDRTGSGANFYQRYNGNGVDLNRDWPEQGFTFRPYTPWSEPETRAFGRVLQGVGPTDGSGDPKWDGGIDLHGQLTDRAFSFTLMGGSERPFDKNQRILQTVKGAWADAERRLAWSPLIKPNDASTDDPRVYGVQWGTVWDSIAYTVTGALGDWIDSPIGLNADGIDNEMSLSHLSNCGLGSCFDPDIEQLHVDGNKSLVYSMINFTLKDEDTTFATGGRVGYLFNKGVVAAKSAPLSTDPRFTDLPTQEDIPNLQLTEANDYTQEFPVKGPKDEVYNGGITVGITCTNAGGVSPCALSEARLERKKPSEPNAQGEDWEVVNSYFNQSPIYVQAGQALHANLPIPGRYRVRIVGDGTQGVFRADVDFTAEKAWPDPGQVGYRATNMNFWRDLERFAKPGIDKITKREIKSSSSWQDRYDTIVVTNAKLPKKIAAALRRWVRRHDANLVLTDEALKVLGTMGLTESSGIKSLKAYAGYVNFATAKLEVTYDDPLAARINQPGAAEGMSGNEVHRRQTYEPVPIGISIQNANGGDANNSPVWYVTTDAWKKTKGRQRAVGTSGGTTNVSYGEIKYHGGRIRMIGALLPMPTDAFDHPFGLGNYALTYSGYQMLKNVLTWVAK